MSIVFTTTISVAATPEQVWEVLSDFPNYGEWSNFTRITGEPELGSRLKMRMPGFWFSSTVTAVTPNQQLEWSARLVTAGFFLGAHTFTLTDNADGTTTVTNTETFTGSLTRPFERAFAANHNDGGYAHFNQALKSRVEARASVRQTVSASR